jgi:ABC-type maltose transport system permease subunit
MKFLLSIIFFLHIADDYYLQGILAQMKQKQWWIDYCDKYIKGNLHKQEWLNHYKNDYKIALLEHAFSWAFVTSVPYLFCNVNFTFYYIQLLVNSIIHAFVDDLKANKLRINLVQDQFIHFIQLIMTFVVYLEVR